MHFIYKSCNGNAREAEWSLNRLSGPSNVYSRTQCVPPRLYPSQPGREGRPQLYYDNQVIFQIADDPTRNVRRIAVIPAITTITIILLLFLLNLQQTIISHFPYLTCTRQFYHRIINIKKDFIKKSFEGSERIQIILIRFCGRMKQILRA